MVPKEINFRFDTTIKGSAFDAINNIIVNPDIPQDSSYTNIDDYIEDVSEKMSQQLATEFKKELEKNLREDINTI